jgi:hypothetical protein
VRKEMPRLPDFEDLKKKIHHILGNRFEELPKYRKISKFIYFPL